MSFLRSLTAKSFLNAATSRVISEKEIIAVTEDVSDVAAVLVGGYNVAHYGVAAAQAMTEKECHQDMLRMVYALSILDNVLEVIKIHHEERFVKPVEKGMVN